MLLYPQQQEYVVSVMASLSCKCRRHVADMSATCDTVAGFRRHGAVTATQNQLTVPTLYVGIGMYLGRYTFSDDIFAKCVDMSPTCRDIRHFRGKFAPPSQHDTADICSYVASQLGSLLFGWIGKVGAQQRCFAAHSNIIMV